MAFLILDIETIPRPIIDDVVEETISKKIKTHIERTNDDEKNADSLIRSISPFFGQLICIGIKWLQDDKTSKDKVICEESEKKTLLKFFDIINHPSSNNLRFVHYNGLGFDIPFLIIRAAHYGIEINNWNFKDLKRFSYKSHIDLMMFLCNWNNYNAISLDIACRSFNITSPKEGEVAGHTVSKAYEEGDIASIEEYVMRDVNATCELFDKLKQYIIK